MQSLMRYEIALLDEAFSTFVANIRFLPRVNSLMHSEIALIHKAFSTFAADTGFWPPVNSPVYNEVAILEEAFSTVTAYEGFLSCVCSLFSEHEDCERFPVLNALTWLLTCMNDLMISQTRPLFEGFPTVTHYVSLLSFQRFDELGLSTDEFSAFVKFHFSLKLFTVGLETGFSNFRKLSTQGDSRISSLVK